MIEEDVTVMDMEALARECLMLGVPVEQLGLVVPDFPVEHAQPQG